MILNMTSEIIPSRGIPPVIQTETKQNGIPVKDINTGETHIILPETVEAEQLIKSMQEQDGEWD